MGYYTDFTMKIDGPEDKIQELRDSNEKGAMDYGHLFENFTILQSGLCVWSDVKWYEYKEDMQRISELNPELFFTLWGDGEEEKDLWVAYFYQGQYEWFKAQIAYPETTIVRA